MFHASSLAGRPSPVPAISGACCDRRGLLLRIAADRVGSVQQLHADASVLGRRRSQRAQHLGTDEQRRVQFTQQPLTDGRLIDIGGEAGDRLKFLAVLGPQRIRRLRAKCAAD